MIIKRESRLMSCPEEWSRSKGWSSILLGLPGLGLYQ